MKEGDPHPGYYIIGTPSDLEAKFPGYKGNDVRMSSDGRSIYEVRLTEPEKAAIGADARFAVLTHSEAIELIASERTKWEGEGASETEYTQEGLSSKTKTQLVEIADAKGVSTSGLTKAELVDAILGVEA